MYSHKYKYGFVSISKTACDSMCKVLEEPTEGIEEHHQDIKDIKECLTEEQFNEYYKFAFVRNPWDKMVSQYFWGQQIDIKAPWNNYPFEEFILDLCREKKVFLTHPNYYRSCYDWITIDGKVEVNFIGTFENLQEDWSIVCDKLGVNLPLIHTHKTQHKNYRDYYNDWTKWIVEKYYAKDIEMFNYKF